MERGTQSVPERTAPLDYTLAMAFWSIGVATTAPAVRQRSESGQHDPKPVSLAGHTRKF